MLRRGLQPMLRTLYFFPSANSFRTDLPTSSSGCLALAPRLTAGRAVGGAGALYGAGAKPKRVWNTKSPLPPLASSLPCWSGSAC